MITIHPFQAWRPRSHSAVEIACVPYDVIDSHEARQLSEGNERSFLHVIRPEIDLPEDTGLYDDIVYETGAANLHRMQQRGWLVQDATPQLYLYRQQMGSHEQTGLFSCVSVNDYDNNRILKHELTRPDKEDDRTRHILNQRAHAEPVMLTFRQDDGFEALVGKECSRLPIYDFTASDGVSHKMWQVSDPDAFVELFTRVDRLSIADGHHRCKSASRVAEQLRTPGSSGDEEFEFFPAVLFPMNQMQILPYNRTIKQVPESFMQQLGEMFEYRLDTSAVPEVPGRVSLYYKGVWVGIDLPDGTTEQAVDALDVSRLQQYILKPLLGIHDARTDKNIDFVGGIRGIAELEKRVDSRQAELAISMYPTQIDQLVSVADEDCLMPPKSTWFEPKLRSGLLIHAF